MKGARCRAPPVRFQRDAGDKRGDSKVVVQLSYHFSGLQTDGLRHIVEYRRAAQGDRTGIKRMRSIPGVTPFYADTDFVGDRVVQACSERAAYENFVATSRRRRIPAQDNQ